MRSVTSLPTKSGERVFVFVLTSQRSWELSHIICCCKILFVILQFGRVKIFCLGNSLEQTLYYFWTTLVLTAGTRGEEVWPWLLYQASDGETEGDRNVGDYMIMALMSGLQLCDIVCSWVWIMDIVNWSRRRDWELIHDIQLLFISAVIQVLDNIITGTRKEEKHL